MPLLIPDKTTPLPGNDQKGANPSFGNNLVLKFFPAGQDALKYFGCAGLAI
jgi:hypothetical protein